MDTTKGYELAGAGAKSKEAELKEQFLERITFISDFWRTINDPEVGNLPLDEFQQKLSVFLHDGLPRIIPDAEKYQEEIYRRKDTIDMLRADISDEKQRAVTDKFYTGKERQLVLAGRLIDANKNLRNLLEDPDASFVYSLTSFSENLSLKKTQIDMLRAVLEIQEPKERGATFVTLLENSNFSPDKDGVVRPLTSDRFLVKLIAFLKGKIAKGVDIFTFITINPYDICFYLDKKEAKQKLDVEDKNLGAHVSNTPLCFIYKEGQDQEDNDDNIAIHERGHSMVSMLNEDLGVHRYVYAEEFMKGLEKEVEEFKKAYRESVEDEDVGEGSAEEKFRAYIRDAITNLNAEISADARNVIDLNSRAFLAHFSNLILALGNYVITERGNIAIGESTGSDKFLQIIEEERDRLLEVMGNLTIRVARYAYLAKKYGLEDEFCSALVLMPDSYKYIKRLLEIKLGEDFETEIAQIEFCPEIILRLQPRLYQGVYKYFDTFYVREHKRKLTKSNGGDDFDVAVIVPPEGHDSMIGLFRNEERFVYQEFFDNFIYSKHLDENGLRKLTELLRSTPEEKVNPIVLEKLRFVLEGYANEAGELVFPRPIDHFATVLSRLFLVAEKDNEKFIELVDRYKEAVFELCDYLGLDLKEKINARVEKFLGDHRRYN